MFPRPISFAWTEHLKSTSGMPSDTILFALSQKPPKTSELHTEKTTQSDVASFQTKTLSVKKSIKTSVIVLKSILGLY